ERARAGGDGPGRSGRAAGACALRRGAAEPAARIMSGGGEERDPNSRLVEVTLDEASIRRATPDIDHERKVAIFDLLEDNFFRLEEHGEGPYCLSLSLAENRLVFAVASEKRRPLATFML